MNPYGNKKLLLVEDVFALAVVEKYELEQRGYLVTHVADGQEAFDVVVNNNEPIDLILMDINLGDTMDGISAAKLILERREMPILFLSNHTDADTVTKTEEVTSYGYVVKDSGITVLDVSIKMAFRLFEAKQKERDANRKLELSLVNAENENESLRAFSFLFQINNVLGPVANPEDTQQIAELCLNYFNADRCYYCELIGQDAVIRRDSTRGSLSSVAGTYPLSAFPIFKSVVDGEKPFVVEDVHSTHLLDEPLQKLCASLEIISFIDVPVIKKGQPVGILCITQKTARKWRQKEIELAKEIADRFWMVAERIRIEEELMQELTKKEILIKEVHHRIKNNFSSLLSILKIQSKMITSEQGLQVINQSMGLVESIKSVYENLLTSTDYKHLSLKKYIEKLAYSIVSLSAKNITLNMQIEEIEVEEKVIFPMGVIINELITNSIKHGFHSTERGIISISISVVNGLAKLRYQDNGVGFDGNSIAQSSGLGTTLIKLFTQQLKGTSRYVSDNGLRFELDIPLRSA